MELICSALGDDVDRGTRGKTKLRGVGVAVDLEFLNRFGGDVEAGLAGTVLVLAAVNRDQVVSSVAAADREAGTQEARNASRKLGSRSVRVGNAR